MACQTVAVDAVNLAASSDWVHSMQLTLTTFLDAPFLTYHITDFDGKTWTRTIPVPTTWCLVPT